MVKQVKEKMKAHFFASDGPSYSIKLLEKLNGTTTSMHKEATMLVLAFFCEECSAKTIDSKKLGATNKVPAFYL